MSSSRSFRLETRSRARDEIKKIVQTVDKVRKWEKKWVDLGLSNSVKVYKWVPVREDTKEDESKNAELASDTPATIDVGMLHVPPSTLGVQELGSVQSLPANIFAGEPPTTGAAAASSEDTSQPAVISNSSPTAYNKPVEQSSTETSAPSSNINNEQSTTSITDPITSSTSTQPSTTVIQQQQSSGEDTGTDKPST